MMNKFTWRSAISAWGILAGFAAPAQTVDTAFSVEIARHREHYKQEFLTEARSPLRAPDTAFLDFFPADPAWRVTTHFERTPDARPFDLPTYSGITRRYVKYGVLRFEISGKPYQLSVYQNLTLIQQEAYKDHLFLPFKDHTNGDSTYGGGRYFDLSRTDIAADGTLVLDFNKCYNPWCAYSDGYNCPIPPAENHLELAVPAGEKMFKGEHKH